MLVVQNKFDKSKSKYKCNRCNAELGQKNRYGIYIAEYLECPHKKWDLCPKCYKALCRGIEKGDK